MIPRLILASRSPRRRDLLRQWGYDFEVQPADDSVEENLTSPPDSPRELVRYLARLKAENVAEKYRSEQRKTDSVIILASDSLAVCKGVILGKPKDIDDARSMLRLLSGSRHEVHSGLALYPLPTGKPVFKVDTSVLVMNELSDSMLESYLASGLWQGKAGAFGYQDGNDWLRLESGSPSNVVGLPRELFESEYHLMLQHTY